MITVLCIALTLSTPPQAGGGGQSQTFGAQQQTPPRDATTEKKGTGVLKGRVVSAENGKPLRRVQISISAPELGENRTVSTNALGVFEISLLPAGRYTVTASRSGYLRLQYGQRRPGEAGRPLQLADGQKAESIDFALPRMGVIAGRITDEVGEPLAGVTVFPMQARYFRGKRRMTPIGGGVRTDDTGQYRLLALEPGEYYVMGTTRETWTMEGDEKQQLGFGPTYFGGTTTMSDAQRVKVALGQEVPSVDFSMVPGRVASISGNAMDSSGAPLGGETVSLMQEFAGPTFTSSFGFNGAKINADGSFTIKNVPPGDYKLSVRAPGDKDRAAEGAAATVSVTGPDVDGVLLTTGAGATLSGRIVTDGGGALPSGTNRLRVSGRPVDPDSTYQRFTEDNGRVRDDSTFELTDVIGAQRLSVGSVPSGWAVKAIEYDGKDYADIPIDARNGQKLQGIAIVLSNRLPTVRGTLIDEKAQPAAGTVVLFADDPAKWGESSRVVRTARPDQSGAFEIRLVPPGDYLIAPLEYVQDGTWNDPEFLQGLRDRATRVTLNEGEAKGVSLTLKK